MSKDFMVIDPEGLDPLPPPEGRKDWIQAFVGEECETAPELTIPGGSGLLN